MSILSSAFEAISEVFGGATSSNMHDDPPDDYPVPMDEITFTGYIQWISKNDKDFLEDVDLLNVGAEGQSDLQREFNKTKSKVYRTYPTMSNPDQIYTAIHKETTADFKCQPLYLFFKYIFIDIFLFTIKKTIG